MPYLILGLAVVVGVVLLIRGLAVVDPKRAVRAIKWIVVVVIVATAVYFAFSRGIGATMLTMALLLPLLARGRGFARFMRNLRGPTPGHTSDVETAYLRMSLDHDSGTLDGTVLQGAFRGRRLQELSREQILELLAECRIEDEQSAAVLETYLDRVHGAGPGADPGADPGAAGSGGSHGSSRWGNGTMTREEACEILGVEPGASTGEIKDAHHKLMLKMHPDQGGSNYLATKIYQAKDFLLGN
jgi:hypothetical protein